MTSLQKRFNQTFRTIDQVLTGTNVDRSGETTSKRSTVDGSTSLSLPTAAIIVVIAGCSYGAAMGCYAAMANQRAWTEQWLQMLFSGFKVPLLILATLAIALPNFFVLNTLVGLRSQFKESLKAILLAQAGLTIILLSLAPITLFVYISVSPIPSGYTLAVLWNAVAFGVASVSAQLLLRKNYRHLIKQNHKHRWMVRIWIFVYAFVGIQMAYVLRPFIGSPSNTISFFREDPFENAYVTILNLIWSTFNFGASLC